MNEQQYRYLFGLACVQARAISNEPITAGRKMRAGTICNSCKVALPVPHTPGLKRCESCASRHLVFMYFRHRHGWHCAFTTEARKKLPKEFTFNRSSTVRELASRGNGLIDKWDSKGFELGLDIGKGGIWLRLTDEQYLALGGVL